ncbi:MAG: hypothetical protein SPJ69_02390 [Campylobacter sp.]|uniref:hypothetical protein n=1 Tax=Campylobacter sp. TaxID=205 RepID=UPI0029756049|nr:hypothetical protein [Campylobacter sp.]MDD7600817.1 hypothetical protein [Campylobacteraceae bacterium]MDY5887149.1 hypothetical protein [Campylobacter sp.]
MILRLFFTLFASFVYLQAGNLLTYNLYSRAENFDIVLGFDEPYNAQIRQQNRDGKIILLLENTKIKKNFSQALNSKFLNSISIMNFQGQMLGIELKSDKNLQITPARNPDKKTMLIRITPKAISNFSELGAQKTSSVDGKYTSLIIVLSLLCIALVIIKKRLDKKIKNAKTAKAVQKNPSRNSRKIEQSVEQKPEQNTQKNIESKKTDFASELANADFDIENTAKIIFEKPLDDRNKVVLFEHNARKYLVLTGSSNVLLDRFGEDNIRTQSDFELFFEQNKNMLANFISKRTNSLENYKNNLSAE